MSQPTKVWEVFMGHMRTFNLGTPVSLHQRPRLKKDAFSGEDYPTFVRFGDVFMTFAQVVVIYEQMLIRVARGKSVDQPWRRLWLQRAYEPVPPPPETGLLTDLRARIKSMGKPCAQVLPASRERTICVYGSKDSVPC